MAMLSFLWASAQAASLLSPTSWALSNTSPEAVLQNRNLGSLPRPTSYLCRCSLLSSVGNEGRKGRNCPRSTPTRTVWTRGVGTCPRVDAGVGIASGAARPQRGPCVRLCLSLRGEENRQLSAAPLPSSLSAVSPQMCCFLCELRPLGLGGIQPCPAGVQLWLAVLTPLWARLAPRR